MPGDHRYGEKFVDRSDNCILSSPDGTKGSSDVLGELEGFRRCDRSVRIGSRIRYDR